MYGLISSSFLLAFVFTVIPMGEWGWCRPEFVVMLVVYWCTFHPLQFGLTLAFATGLLLDLVEMMPLGFNSLGILFIAYLCHQVYRRVRNYVYWQQGLWVFVLVGLFHLLSNWLGGFFGKEVDQPLFLVSAMLSGLFWIPLVLVLQRLKVGLRLNQ